MNIENLNTAYELPERIFGAAPVNSLRKCYDLLNDISKTLVQYRIDHNLSQTGLAKILGVSQAMVSKYESGDYNISLVALAQLADKLGLSLNLELKNTTAEPAASDIPYEPQYQTAAQLSDHLPDDLSTSIA